MRILIVEDNQFKIDKMMTFLEKLGYTEITARKSYNAALTELLDMPPYDLILLDISIPTFDAKVGGGEFMPSGGKHLLNQIHLNNIAAKVIVVTLYRSFDDGSLIDELNKQFEDYYPDNYMGYVLYNIHNDKWQSDLEQLIKKR